MGYDRRSSKDIRKESDKNIKKIKKSHQDRKQFFEDLKEEFKEQFALEELERLMFTPVSDQAPGGPPSPRQEAAKKIKEVEDTPGRSLYGPPGAQKLKEPKGAKK